MSKVIARALLVVGVIAFVLGAKMIWLDHRSNRTDFNWTNRAEFNGSSVELDGKIPACGFQVRFTASASKSMIQSVVTQAHATVSATIPKLHLYYLGLAGSCDLLTVQKAVDAVKGMPGVVYAVSSLDLPVQAY